MNTQTLETLSDKDFKTFFDQLPERVKLLVRSGVSDWKKVLPQWYEKFVATN